MIVMKVALCFWGLTRSLKYTIDSIQSNILNIFKKHGIQYTIFMHTYSINRPYSNTWAKEYNITLDNDEYKLLNPDYIQIDDQDKIKDILQLDQYRSMPDHYNNGYETIDNFILAMYSKLQLTLLIQKSGIDYDYYIYLRPDVKYNINFNIYYFNLVNDTTIAIPNFNLCGYNNLFNDKFCIANINTYFIYGSIFNQLLDYSKKYSLHPESIYFINLSSNYIKLVYIPFYFNIIRANGEELELYKNRTIVSFSRT